MSEKPKTSYQHGFELSYGEYVGPKLARKVMRDIYRMVEYQIALEEIAPMCGNPDAVDACRLILNKCQETLKDG